MPAIKEFRFSETNPLLVADFCHLNRPLPAFPPRVIAVNGDICTGSSLFASELATLLTYYGYKYQLVTICNLFRLLNRGNSLDQWPSLNIHAIVDRWTRNFIATSRHVIVEGRLVGLQAQAIFDVLTVLCTANAQTRVQRLASREQLELTAAQRRLDERSHHDAAAFSQQYGVTYADLFRPDLFHVNLDTSQTPATTLAKHLVGIMLSAA